MPAGASKRREREYDELKREFKREGRYRGREEEVAARIVNKQRSEFGEAIAAREDDRRGRSPDRALPVENYDRLPVDRIGPRLRGLSRGELLEIERYERRHKGRTTLLAMLGRRLEEVSDAP
jgi:hypothetical protein